VAGAMCAWMRNTINPTLMSSTEYQPCLVHAGPFANIAVDSPPSSATDWTQDVRLPCY